MEIVFAYEKMMTLLNKVIRVIKTSPECMLQLKAEAKTLANTFFCVFPNGAKKVNIHRDNCQSNQP